MQVGIDGRRTRYTLFLLLALTINLVDSALVRSVANPRQRTMVAAAAAFDMVVIVAAFYYWLLVRTGIRARWSVMPIALAGLVHATYLYPDAGSARAVVAGLGEAALIGFVTLQVRNRIERRPGGAQAGDPVEAIQAALQRFFPLAQAAHILATEFTIMYYAFFSWRAQAHVPRDAKAFTIYKKAAHRDLLYGMALVSLIETLPAHLLIHHWSPSGAWIATGFSLYAAVWLIGLARSIELRPVLVGPDSVDVRYGLLFRLRIPRGSIVRVRRAEPADAASAVVLPRRSVPNLCIELAGPMEAEKLFGGRKRVERIAISADEEQALEEALVQRMPD